MKPLRLEHLQIQQRALNIEEEALHLEYLLEEFRSDFALSDSDNVLT